MQGSVCVVYILYGAGVRHEVWKIDNSNGWMQGRAAGCYKAVQSACSSGVHKVLAERAGQTASKADQQNLQQPPNSAAFHLRCCERVGVPSVIRYEL